MVQNSGPYLIAAALCESVLEEKTGTLSAIRMIDRITVTSNDPSAPDQMPVTTARFTLLISLKSGSARGKHFIKFRPETPSGLKPFEQSFPVLFEGEDRGINLVLAINFQLDQEGLYWFDILLEEDLLTRIPLRVLYQKMIPGR